MASCSLRIKQARHQAAASNSGVLPSDVLFNVLLLFPAKDLCRLRAVCRSWRYLTSDPLFIKAHAARRPGPLLLASFRDDKTHIDITDLSGNVVKRIGNTDGHMVLCPGLELACVATERNYCHVLNPATGAVYVLPKSPAKEHVNHEHLRKPYTSFAFGRVASTGEYKVLRMFNRLEFAGINLQQLCEVFTINSGTGHDRWRQKQSPEPLVEANCSVWADRVRVAYEVNSSVVVDGVVYFMIDSIYDAMMVGGLSTGIHPACIASFDLETEQWREDLQGPISRSFVLDGDDNWDEYIIIWHRITLAELKGYLALAYHHRIRSTLDLWFLTDFDNGVWVKEYSIRTESDIPNNERFVKPLVVLDDGRIIIHLVSTGLLLICDPTTNTFAELGMRNLAAVGLYTGSLLSMENGDMV